MSSLITIGLFLIARFLYQRKPWLIFVPVLFGVIGGVVFLKTSGYSYSDYFEDNRLLTFMLGPSVVALGVLMHRQIDAIRAHLWPLFISVSCGSLFSVFLVAVLAGMLKFPTDLAASLMPMGITTPIAIEVSQVLSGEPAITSVIVIGIGLMGNLFSPYWLRWFVLKDEAAAGVAIGTVSHGIGTARAVLLSEKTGVFSGLAMSINGLITVFTAPLVWNLIYG